MYGIAGITSPHASFLTKERLCVMSPNAKANSIWVNNNCNTSFVFSNETFSENQYLHYTITLDGEIYNYKNLQTELEKLGYRFSIQNNETIIIAAFDYWKEKCMEHLDGAFVFVIHDSLEDTLFIVRDRLGEKQLYYYADFQERGRFVQFLFASEMKALWQAGVPKKLDGAMILNYLTLGYTNNPNKKMATFYSDILSLPAGHFLKIKPSEGRTQMRCWYRPLWQSQENVSDQHTIETFKTLFSLSLQNRLENNSPIGLIWENDLNSAAIATFAKAFTASDISIFSSDKENKTALQFPFVYIPFNTTELEKKFTQFCQLLDEQPANINAFTQYQIHHAARQHHATTLLDTLGADEALGGKIEYVDYYLRYLLRENYSLYKKEKRSFLENGFLQTWTLKNYLHAFMTEKTSKQDQKNLTKIQNQFPFLDAEFLLRYQNPDILRQPEIHRPEDLMYFEVYTMGIENQLKWKNKIATHFSQKMRYPFLQYQLVEWLFSLPSNVKFKNGFNKWLLRESVENLLPQGFAWQKNILKSDSIHFDIPIQIKNSAIQKLVDAKVLSGNILDKKNLNPPFNKTQEWRLLNTAHFIENI